MFDDFFSKPQLKKSIILFAIGLVLLILYIVLDYFLKWNQELGLGGYIISVIYILIGWMGSNHIGNDYHRKNKDYSALPLEIVNKKMEFRSPYIASGLVILTITCIFDLINTIIKIN